MAREYLTIGELAARSGVPISTVRYYERRGLVAPLGRSSGDYRLYGQQAISDMDFIATAKASGFTLRDIALLMGMRSTGLCADVEPVFRTRSEAIMQSIRALEDRKASLISLAKTCLAESQTCKALEELSRPAAE